MKPILFNTEMVKAILEGRKTVTRRVVKIPQGRTLVAPVGKDSAELGVMCMSGVAGGVVKAPYQVGDVLYVRETWCNWADDIGDNFFYKAKDDGVDGFSPKWKPSIHMPKKAARIFLRVTGVRVERLQDITEKQARAEGVARLFDNEPDQEYIDWTKRAGLYPKKKSEWGYLNYLWHGNYGKYGTGNWKTDNWDYQYSAYDTAVESFSSLWNSTLTKDQLKSYGWEANPYVWVIEFEVIDRQQT